MPNRTTTPARLALVALLLAGCESQGPTDATRPEDEPLRLLEPAAGAGIPQNDPSIGCPAHPTRGHGFRIDFDWTDAPATADLRHYRLVVRHRGSELDALDTHVAVSEYVFLSCNGFVIDANLDDWEWRVRTESRMGEPGEWVVGGFRFLPCRLANGVPCNAPG